MHAYVRVCVCVYALCGVGMFRFTAAVIEGMYKDPKSADMEVQYLNFTHSEGKPSGKPRSQLQTKNQPLPKAQRKTPPQQMENQLLQELQTKTTSQPVEKQPPQKLQTNLLPQPKEKHMPLTKCAEVKPDKVDPPFKKRQWNVPPGTM